MVTRRVTAWSGTVERRRFCRAMKSMNLRSNGAYVFGLAVGLTLPAILPEVANIGFLAFGAVAIMLMLWDRRLRRAPLNFGPVVPIAAACLLAIASLYATRSLTSLLGVGYFVPLYLIWPLALFASKGNDAISPASISMCAAAGGAVALAVVSFDKLVLGLSEPGSSVSNPIHYADLLVTLAVLSLAGCYDRRTVIRGVALAGMACALTAIWMTTSRGALLAIPFVALTALTVVIWQNARGTRRAFFALLPAMVSAVGGVLAWQGGLLDRISIYADVVSFFRAGPVSDLSTGERLTMYQAAWEALKASPIFGHGLFNVASTAASFARGNAAFPLYDHLHSDMADFSVAAGALGILAYAAFLLAPLVAAGHRAELARQQSGQFIAATTAVGYLVMGATNAVLGVLTLTVLYAVVTILVVHLARPAADIYPS